MANQKASENERVKKLTKELFRVSVLSSDKTVCYIIIVVVFYQKKKNY
jgi:hypothetical protein